MKIVRTVIVMIAFVWTWSAFAQQIIHRDDLLSVFDNHSATGSFAVLDTNNKRLTVVGTTRANKPLIPASTFKIVNSLIALETGVVADEHDVVPYVGGVQPVKVWERDMSIRDGIRVSNVPVFQEIARRIGLPRYADYLARLGFGNQQLGDDVETFWLNGPLRISAVDYIHFLARLAGQELPLSTSSQLTVRDMIRLESKGDAALFGKTGWTIAPDPDIGWFVGWVERDGRIWSFALNMDIATRADAKLRMKLTRTFLAQLNLY